MRIGSHDIARRVLIVAEVGNNHEGDFARAAELIRRAAAAGADAVKFQTYRTELFVRPQDTERFARLRSFELSYDQFAQLAELAAEHRLLFLSTPLDLESAAFLEPRVPAFKIASGDNNFVPLLEQVAASRKPVLLSGGLASLADLRRSIDRIERIWRAQGARPGLAVLHCVASYPTPLEQASLASIAFLREGLGVPVGYSDHTLGIEACVLAVAAGARIIEKHFTLDHDLSDFRDHKLSADPDELAVLVRRVRAAEALLGEPGKLVQPAERDNQRLLRRAIVARRDLPAGVPLRLTDLLWQRPADGLPPGSEARIVGRCPRRAIRAGESITAELFAAAEPLAALSGDGEC